MFASTKISKALDSNEVVSAVTYSPGGDDQITVCFKPNFDTVHHTPLCI